MEGVVVVVVAVDVFLVLVDVHFIMDNNGGLWLLWNDDDDDDDDKKSSSSKLFSFSSPRLDTATAAAWLGDTGLFLLNNDAHELPTFLLLLGPGRFNNIGIRLRDPSLDDLIDDQFSLDADADPPLDMMSRFCGLSFVPYKIKLRFKYVAKI